MVMNSSGKLNFLGPAIGTGERFCHVLFPGRGLLRRRCHLTSSAQSIANLASFTCSKMLLPCMKLAWFLWITLGAVSASLI